MKKSTINVALVVAMAKPTMVCQAPSSTPASSSVTAVKPIKATNTKP
jgi:hypothetical protein